jgi:hypothetical protein
MKIPPDTIRPMPYNPRRDSEQNLKYRFAKACEDYGLQFYLEYPSRWNGTPGCRFDLVIHDGKFIKALVEIKKKSENKKRGELWLNTRQCKKYLAFGVPVFLVYDDNDFAAVLNEI